MKKIICLLTLFISLSGCTSILPSANKKTANPDERYKDLIEIISEHDNFLNASNNFNIDVEMSKISDGYRFYVTVDEARNAMYDIEAIAIEDGVDYASTMAANIGIFDEKEYNMVPYQSNPSKGFVKGVVMSGLTQNKETTLYILIQWKKEDRTTTNREIFKLDVAYGD